MTAPLRRWEASDKVLESRSGLDTELTVELALR
jgi:hypothetical protein